MAKSWWKARGHGKKRPAKPVGVPAGPLNPPAQPEHALTLDSIFNVVRHIDFFQINAAFEPMRDPTIRTLKDLAKRGIIVLAGTPKTRRTGCPGCLRRRLNASKVAIARNFQSCVLNLQKDEAAFESMASKLEAYLTAKKLKAPNHPAVLYARIKDGSIRRVEFPCRSSTS